VRRNEMQRRERRRMCVDLTISREMGEKREVELPTQVVKTNL